MKKVVVTGGAGFIGSHVAEYYANQENVDEVFVIDNLSRSKLLEREIKNQDYNWRYYLNGGEGSIRMDEYIIKEGDNIEFRLIGIYN